MELDLQSLFGLHVYVQLYSLLIGWDPAAPSLPPSLPPSPAFGLIYECAICQPR